MTYATNLFRRVEEDWKHQADGPAAHAALARWAAEDETLAGYTTPRQLVEHCHARDREEAARILRAVARWVGRDRWAAHTVLAAVLPGLARTSRRASGFVGSVWQSIEELDQQVLATAWDRIRQLGEEPEQWPAVAVVDSTWQRVRTYALAECRAHARQLSLEHLSSDAWCLAAPPVRTPAEELAAALVDVVERGVVTTLDAGLVYSSRIGGTAVETLAAELGTEPRTTFRRRARVEKLLLGEDEGRPRGLQPVGVSD